MLNMAVACMGLLPLTVSGCRQEKGDYANKISHFDRLGTPRPGSESDYVHKADFDKAIADFTQAIQLDPKNALAYYHRGWAHHDKRDYDRAIADYTEAIRIHLEKHEEHRIANIYSCRLGAYRASGNKEKAARDECKLQELVRPRSK
jgi:tetratricopeptide (TPR) repeat protein